MSWANGYHLVAGLLIVLIGALCAVGAVALWRGKPEDWSDVVATNAVVMRVARVLAIVAALMLISGALTITAVPYGWAAGAIATLLFVIGGFAGNYYIFGDLRPMHTGTNSLIAGIVWVLIWLGAG